MHCSTSSHPYQKQAHSRIKKYGSLLPNHSWLKITFFAISGSLRSGEIAGIAITLILLLLVIIVVVLVIVFRLKPLLLRGKYFHHLRTSSSSRYCDLLVIVFRIKPLLLRGKYIHHLRSSSSSHHCGRPSHRLPSQASSAQG